MADEAKVALGRNVRRLITWGMYGLGLACLGALGLRSILTNLPIELAPDLLRPASLWKVLISLYALSWYYGTTFDNRYQIDVITSAPEGRLPIGSVAVAVTIFVLFAAMWWLDVFSDTIANAYLPWLGAATSEGLFDLMIVVLAGFWIFNIFAWRFYLARHMTGLIAKSRIDTQSSRDYLRNEMLDQIDQFISGRWQWARFLSGMVVLLLIIIVAKTHLRDDLARLLARVAGPQFISETQLRAVLPHILVVVWFIESEAVIWFMRIRLKFYVDCLQRLKRKYVMTPLRA